jgi:hypothetical protein
MSPAHGCAFDMSILPCVVWIIWGGPCLTGVCLHAAQDAGGAAGLLVATALELCDTESDAPRNSQPQSQSSLRDGQSRGSSHHRVSWSRTALEQTEQWDEMDFGRR